MDTGINVETYRVYFVLEAGMTEDKANTSMKKAFAAMLGSEHNPTWVNADKLPLQNSSRPSLFVCDPFEGNAYERLRDTSQKIFGPLCVISCLEHNDILPNRPHPVYSVCMRKLGVTCSTMASVQRLEIRKKILLMGGQFYKDLTSNVTHLVASEVGSKKYKVAVEFKLPIMLPEWVDSCWNEAQHTFKHAADPVYFSPFVCPPFKGLTISVSQIESGERKKMQTLIQRHGGKYTGPMKAKETTHVILLKPEGDKYKFAVVWKLNCVTPAWLYDSIEARCSLEENGYCLDENNPRIHGSSTPKKGQRGNSTTLLSDCSTITNISLCSRMDETAMTDFSITSGRMSVLPHPLDIFNVASIPKNCQFLDGCRIYPCGFSGSQMEKIQRIINAGGGTRYSKPSESVTHIVVKEKSDVDKIPDISDVGAHVVSFHWLIDCCKGQTLADEQNYLCYDSLSLSPQKLIPSLKPTLDNDQTSTIHGLATNTSVDYDELMKQYMPPDGTDINSGMESATVRNDTTVTKEASMDTPNETTVTRVASMDKPNEKSNVANGFHESTLQGETVDTELIFLGSTFAVSGFVSQHQDSLTEMIESNGGVVVTGELSWTDYEVLPLLRDRAAAPAITKGRFAVTNCWLQMCIEQEALLPLDHNPLFKQLSVDMGSTPLKDFVLTFSQFQGTERDTLMHLAEALGATCQEYFVRTVNKSRGLMPNTHLVVEEPDGSKYIAAKKWKIPAVTKDWLLVTARTGRKAEENNFLVDLETTNAELPPVDTNVPARTTANLEEKSSTVAEDDSATCKKGTPKDSDVSKNTDAASKDQTGGDVVLQNEGVHEPIDENPSIVPAPATTGRNLDFLNPGSNYRPNFDLEDIMGCFDSPEPSTSRKRSLSIGSLFAKNIVIACKNQGIDKSFSAESSCLRILKGVVIYVARKLANRQSELNRLCGDLGGDYLWSYDSSCTHFIYQGKAGDVNKELRIAKDQRKKLVSPEWLAACRDEEVRVDESLYPMTFNPRLSISSQVEGGGGEIAQCQKSPVSMEQQPATTALQEDAVNRSNSSEVLCDVGKQLEELMALTKCAAIERRVRRTNSSSGSPSPADSGARAKITPVRSRLRFNHQEPPAVEPEPSQSIPIGWDDPTGRMEREKVAEQLARMPDTQDTQERKEDDIPEETINKTFIFSGLNDNDKKKYTSVVQRLGGTVVDAKQYDDLSTHLVIGAVLKNEKFLSSVAAGKWVLMKSYVEESGREGQFVEEERHEWGGPATNRTKIPEKMKEASWCPRRWRVHYQETQSRAFQDWRVIVAAEHGVKLETYRRILEAGGATILPITVPYDKCQKATMAIVEMSKKAELELDYDGLASAGVKCVKPEYLAVYLVEKNPPPMERYLVAPPTFGNSILASRKRKPNGSVNSPKRNRQSD